jgi:hypothetical protein
MRNLTTTGSQKEIEEFPIRYVIVLFLILLNLIEISQIWEKSTYSLKGCTLSITSCNLSAKLVKLALSPP